MPHSAVDPSTSHEQPVDGVAQGSASAGAASGDSGGEPASVKKATSFSYGASWPGAGPEARARTATRFESRAPWYRRTAIFWVMNAKKEETRVRRLATLIADSARGKTIGPLTRPKG